MPYAKGGVKNNEDPLKWFYLKSSRTVQFLKNTHKECEGVTNVIFQDIDLDLPRQTATVERRDASPQTEENTYNVLDRMTSF